MLFLGIDVGSSSVKVSVLDGDTGQCVGSAQYPEQELAIASPKPGFAEQDPMIWWDSFKQALSKLKANINLKDIAAVGISYQMHGLVLTDANHQVLRPAIIWCDSRAVEIGEQARNELGDDYCFGQLLNSPGNFTAAKLRWVQQNEPILFKKIRHIMLPGDYIALQLSGQATTTASGLSEGTLWNFAEESPARELLAHWGVDSSVIPELMPTFGEQCQVSAAAAEELGLKPGTPVSYRAGDQPNNAFSLNVLKPGEVAATAGTSGVIYAVTDKAATDRQSRVNTFMHVTSTANAPRNGILACVNGTGRAYSWLRQILAEAGGAPSYPALNNLTSGVPVGSDGLMVVPFGNGAERLLGNKNIGAHWVNMDYNRHQLGHMVRATQEGIVFALNKGFEVFREMGASCEVIRAGKSNMFLSDLFTQAFANTTGATVELYNTDGAEGAARAAAVGSGYYSSFPDAFKGLTCLQTVAPDNDQKQYKEAYERWSQQLKHYS